jgi:hypothetical protein
LQLYRPKFAETLFQTIDAWEHARLLLLKALTTCEKLARSPPLRPAEGTIELRVKDDRGGWICPDGEQGEITADQFGVTGRERLDIRDYATISFNDDL